MRWYPHELVERAKTLRKEQTQSEAVLWAHLRNRKFCGMKFKRQHRIGQFIVDFYCSELKLVIELEGGVHDIPDQKEYDAVRFVELQSRRLRILKFKNNEVLNKIDLVLNQIATLSPDSSLPKRERGRGEG